MATYETRSMAVSHEIKSQLAKLLATEDLVVEHRNLETAQFDVHNRVLTLPLWDQASSIVYDMLVGHEVGHALFTPDEDPPKGIPHQFINIVEDARIEKLMKRKYLGLAKTFYKGYSELCEQDFFELEGQNISEMNLADRSNLFFKIGNYVDIPLHNDEEKDIIKTIMDCETFEEVGEAAKKLYQYCKDKQEEDKEKLADMPQQSQGGGSTGNSDSSNETDSDGGDVSDGASSGQQKQSQTGSGTGEQPASSDDEPEVKTVNSLESNLKDLTNSDVINNTYVELPKLNLDSVVAKTQDIHKLIDSTFARSQSLTDEWAKENGYDPRNVFERVDSNYVKFKKSSNKEVNYLVKEFECKKAADSYARATTSRTGVLDCSKLHTYKHNEDLFRKVTTLADGKNHGLIFILDWSGSMSHVLEDTIKQLYNLIWFCKKVSIPFDVYCFTNEWKRPVFDYVNGRYIPADIRPHYEKKGGLLAVDDDFSLMNILTSKVSGKELDRQMLNIWRVVNYYSSNPQYSIPDQLALSATPLNEALVALHQILPKFQKENKVQKVQTIILTDGEANHLAHHVVVDRSWEDGPVVGTRRLRAESFFIRDRKLGRTYQVQYEWHKFTDSLLQNLKDNFPDVNFIGIRVLNPRDANSFMKKYYSFGTDQYDKVYSDWKKTKGFCIRNSGYDAYFGLSASALAQDTDFKVSEDATKSQIKNAFVKSLKTKKLNKKVLGEFISLVA